MRISTLAVAIGLAALSVQAAESRTSRPFEGGEFAPVNAIDTLLVANLNARGLEPANLCSDEVFVRRVYLDVIGALPTPEEVQVFLQDSRTDKRVELIENLLKRDAFADYWSLKWCDVLRVKAEYPINLWPNAVQAYHRWIRDAIRQNLPYDRFVHELLTSSGSNFRVPQVNFYRAVQGRTPAALAGAVALTFMGTRLETWPEARRTDLATFFSRVAYKSTAEWKEEIVYPDPAPAGALQAVFPDSVGVTIAPDEDPRRVFAAWLTTPDNPWLARAVVNRIWAWLLGRGIIHEPDDIRPDNPAVNPELLTYLEKELVTAKYDLRHIYRLILNSAAYQQSSVPRTASPDAEVYFACYPVRRLDAEVLIDALSWIGGTGEEYSSAIPEPFTYIPSEQHTVELADGSITSSYLEMFGRPARDTGLVAERNNEPTDEQRLYLLNSTDIQRTIRRSPKLRRLFAANKGNPGQAVRMIYLGILSRYPTSDELAAVVAYAQRDGLTPPQVAEDLVWALINTKEFLYRH